MSSSRGIDFTWTAISLLDLNASLAPTSETALLSSRPTNCINQQQWNPQLARPNRQDEGKGSSNPLNTSNKKQENSERKRLIGSQYTDKEES